MYDLSNQAREAQESREHEPAEYPRVRYVDDGRVVEIRPNPRAMPHVRAEANKVTLVGFPDYPLDANSAKRWGEALTAGAWWAEHLRGAPSTGPLDSGDWRGPRWDEDVG